MNLINLFLNPKTKELRSGWRALCFATVVLAPFLFVPGFFSESGPEQGAILDVSVGMAAVYLFLIGWLTIVSWLCLRFFERMRLAALGLAFHDGWRGDVLKGFGVSGSMIAGIVVVQWFAGGMRVKINPVLWDEPGAVLAQVIAALLLLIVAAAFEELAYRGYAFQTLLRGAPAIVPIALLSLLFGLAHWNNPSRTSFSTANTILAGIWLSVAYLRTRSLWFPIALHTGWNWVMGAVFGVPVSGLLIPRQPLLLSTSGDPVWLTGGSYGCEGGGAATVVFLLGTLVLWRARWLRVSPQMNQAWTRKIERGEERVSLGLEE
ncbi:MAG: lysostaphin resistance A-like protein [Blastocatellia bacterium]